MFTVVFADATDEDDAPYATPASFLAPACFISLVMLSYARPVNGAELPIAERMFSLPFSP